MHLNKNWYSILREASITFAAFGLGGSLGVGLANVYITTHNTLPVNMFLGVCGLCVLLFIGYVAMDAARIITKKFLGA